MGDYLLHDERPAHRFLIVTIGTRGDIQPYIALANRLIANGHEVGIATHSIFETFVFQNGHEEITFCPLEGDPGSILNDPEFIKAFFEGTANDQLEVHLPSFSFIFSTFHLPSSFSFSF